jgi:PAS domain-containing protein
MQERLTGDERAELARLRTECEALRAELRRARAPSSEESRQDPALPAASLLRPKVLEQLMQAAPVAIAVLSGPDHRFEYLSHFDCQIRNIGGMSLLGCPAADVFPSIKDSGILAVLDEAFRTARPISRREFEIGGVPGGLTCWNLDVMPLGDSESRAEQDLALLVVAQNVTEQVLARREAEQRAAQLEAVLAAIPGGVAIYGPQGELVHSNDLARDLLGLTPEYEAKPVDERMQMRRFAYPDGRPVTQESTPLYRALHGETIRNEIMGIYVGEALIWASISAAPLRETFPSDISWAPRGRGGVLSEEREGTRGGTPPRPDPAAGHPIAGVVLSFIDVSEQRATQEHLQRANEELELRAAQLRSSQEQSQAACEQAKQRAAELDAVLSTIPNGVAIYGPEGQFLHVNARRQI